MGYNTRRETYTPYGVGDYNKDGIVSVVKTEWAASKRSRHGNTDSLRVTLREHLGGLEAYPGDMPTSAMKYMAIHCVEPDEIVLACLTVRKYWHDGGWHKVLDVLIRI